MLDIIAVAGSDGVSRVLIPFPLASSVLYHDHSSPVPTWQIEQPIYWRRKQRVACLYSSLLLWHIMDDYQGYNYHGDLDNQGQRPCLVRTKKIARVPANISCLRASTYRCLSSRSPWGFICNPIWLVLRNLVVAGCRMSQGGRRSTFWIGSRSRYLLRKGMLLRRWSCPVSVDLLRHGACKVDLYMSVVWKGPVKMTSSCLLDMDGQLIHLVPHLGIG